MKLETILCVDDIISFSINSTGDFLDNESSDEYDLNNIKYTTFLNLTYIMKDINNYTSLFNKTSFSLTLFGIELIPHTINIKYNVYIKAMCVYVTVSSFNPEKNKILSFYSELFNISSITKRQDKFDRVNSIITEFTKSEKVIVFALDKIDDDLNESYLIDYVKISITNFIFAFTYNTGNQRVYISNCSLNTIKSDFILIMKIGDKYITAASVDKDESQLNNSYSESKYNIVNYDIPTHMIEYCNLYLNLEEL